MIKTIVLVVVVLFVVAIGGVLAYAATKPHTFVVKRTASINAPADRIFPLLHDFRTWGSWSPYENKDPTMKRTYSGAAQGKGAVYEWDGDKNVGVGRMEIADTAAPSRVTLKLDFTKPFEAHNIVDFTLEPKGDSTTVTWAMHGPAPYMAKIMHVLIDMDREGEPLATRRFGEDLERARQRGVQIEFDGFDLQHPGLDLRGIEDVVDQSEEDRTTGPNAFDVRALRRRERRLDQQAGETDHAVHRRADLVTHVREKLRLQAS